MRLTVRDVARVFNVAEKTIYRWIDEGTLPAYRINNQYRFNGAELLEWATARKINVSPEILRDPEGTGAPLPGLLEALDAGGIHYRVGGAEKPAVLQSVVQLLKLPEDVDRASLYQVLMARESAGSTAIGDGIAIPHVRNPIVLYVNQPSITLCFLEKPIDFGALDGKPVSILFTLICPTVRAHLHLLSRLAFGLRDEQIKSVLARQGSRDEIRAEVTRVEAALALAARADGKEEQAER